MRSFALAAEFYAAYLPGFYVVWLAEEVRKCQHWGWRSAGRTPLAITLGPGRHGGVHMYHNISATYKYREVRSITLVDIPIIAKVHCTWFYIPSMSKEGVGRASDA